MGADLGVPLSDLRLLCVSVAGGESRKTFTQFSKREKREHGPQAKEKGLPAAGVAGACVMGAMVECHSSFDAELRKESEVADVCRYLNLGF